MKDCAHARTAGTPTGLPATYNVVGLTDAVGHIVEQYAWDFYGTVPNAETLPIAPPAQ